VVQVAGARNRVFPRTLGVLGTGLRASAVARRLLDTRPAAVNLTIFGRDLDRLAALESAGARRAASPADLAARSELVIVVLRDLDELNALLGGPSGLQAGVHSPTTVVIGSPIPPDIARDLARCLPESSTGLLRMVDAPLTGRLESIASGTLSIMVGASSAAYLDVRPVLDLLGRSTRLGGVGSGQVATACAQLVVAATAMALGESAVLAERYGLALNEVLASWRGSEVESELLSASSANLTAKSYEPSMPAGDVLAWLQIAEREALRTGTRTDLVHGLLDLYGELSSSDLADVDLSVTQSFVERRATRTFWEQGARASESEMLDEDDLEVSMAAEPGRRTGARHVAAPAARILGSAR
jgi:2-hydroxy-3-oxopropionate reductase